MCYVASCFVGIKLCSFYVILTCFLTSVICEQDIIASTVLKSHRNEKTRENLKLQGHLTMWTQ